MFTVYNTAVAMYKGGLVTVPEPLGASRVMVPFLHHRAAKESDI